MNRTVSNSILLILVASFILGCRPNVDRVQDVEKNQEPFALVLGIAQDGGVPQAGKVFDERWFDPDQVRWVASLAIIDPQSSTYWIVDATPDLPRQITLAARSSNADTLTLGGIFLTHAHMGHYTGLMFLGHEAMGATEVPVYAMPRMAAFLETNGPWDQLVRYGNVVVRNMKPSTPIQLNERISIEPIPVPHRQEYTEVVGFRIVGASSSVLYIPDIDSWDELDETDRPIEELVGTVDQALLDGTFFENGEIPGRDMSGFPHPFIRASMTRFSTLPATERAKILFIHLNHSNPVLNPASTQRAELEQTGMHVARRGQRLSLN